MNKLLESSAVQLGELIERKEISSVELTEMHLERIREVNPKLNAVFHLAEDSARQMALAADKDLARGSRASPLHGVPFTVKDWIEVAGMPCVANDERYRDHIPTQHATVVELMLRAGCVLLGKTSVSDDSPIYGRTYNPYQLDLSPAGSSSGEAAIIAAGGSAFGLGSDSGGSIRDPAHACGIAGLRPTTGRVSVAGHLPRINTLVDPRTVIGPMARFVEDLPMALRFISCSDWRDPSVVWTGSGHWKHVDPLRLCGAFYSHYPGGSPTPDCGRVAEETAELLRGLGVSICEALPGRIDEALPITRAYWSRAGSEGLEDEWAPDGEGQMTGAGGGASPLSVGPISALPPCVHGAVRFHLDSGLRLPGPAARRKPRRRFILPTLQLGGVSVRCGPSRDFRRWATRWDTGRWPAVARPRSFGCCVAD
jgi:amidase